MNFSVLMSVYAREKVANLHQAFSSIWNEQSLKPAQIVLVKDGLLIPELDSEIACWKERLGDVLTIVELKENVGLARALNEGLNLCKFDLIARMDTDDIARPSRFEKQVKFMWDFPGVAASSAFVEEIDGSGNVISLRRLPLSHEDIVTFAKKRSPLSHPVSIFRKQAVIDVGGYPLFRNAQDYALWSLLIVKGYKLANIPEVLLEMRTGSAMYARRGHLYLKNEMKLLRYQRQIGFLSSYGYFLNIFLRMVLRLSPLALKRWLYNVAR